MHFGMKPSEFHYIFLICLGTEIINIHKVPSPRLLVWQSHFCKEACTLYHRPDVKLREYLLKTSKQKVMC